MSDNWDDDDYDPNAQIAAQASDKLATLGLDEVIRQQNKPTSSITQAEEVKATGARSIATVKADQELSENEKREAQLRLDAAAGMDLFGISAERKEPTFDDLRTKSDFQAFADKLGEQIANRHSDSNYLFFVNTLVDHITKPMTKIQLQSVRDIVQMHLDVYMKEEQQKLKQEQKDKDQKDKKKAKNKQVKEDYVEDEYDDYDEKFNRY